MTTLTELACDLAGCWRYYRFDGDARVAEKGARGIGWDLRPRRSYCPDHNTKHKRARARAATS